MNSKTPLLGLSLLGMSCLLAACAGPGQPRGNTVPQARYQPAEASDFLAQTNWTLVRWTAANGRVRPLAAAGKAPPTFTVAFQHQQGLRRIGGNIGCNVYSGDYTVANGLVILVSDPVATPEVCDASVMAMQRDFLLGLRLLRSSTVDDYGNPRRLTLVLGNGDRLEFDRIASG
jgi:heat shock protein HslJ